MPDKESLDYILGGIHEQLKGIHDQTKKTNGRVTDLETKQTETEKRWANLDGRMTIVTFFVPIVTAIAVALINQMFK